MFEGIEKFMFRKAESILQEALPDINKALEEIPISEKDGELKPLLLMNFTKDEIHFTVAIPKLFIDEKDIGSDGKPKAKLILNRIYKKMKFSELNELLKDEESKNKIEAPKGQKLLPQREEGK